MVNGWNSYRTDDNPQKTGKYADTPKIIRKMINQNSY